MNSARYYLEIERCRTAQKKAWKDYLRETNAKEKYGALLGIGDYFKEELLIMRKFKTGAVRDSGETKLDYEGFLSPLVVARFGAYMHAHRKLADGTLRASDNWQRGIPVDIYIKSMWRHFLNVWLAHRQKGAASHDLEEELCALLFNVQGYLHELLTCSSAPTKEPAPQVLKFRDRGATLDDTIPYEAPCESAFPTKNAR